MRNYAGVLFYFIPILKEIFAIQAKIHGNVSFYLLKECASNQSAVLTYS